MKIPWDVLKQHIEAGAVFRDECFKFADGETKPKWFVILSSKLCEENYVYCLTTSQTGTYRSSYSDFVETTDVFAKTTIIEIERINLIPLEVIKQKYGRDEIEYKGTLKKETMDQVYEKIECSDRIEAFYKDWILDQ
jgi:hypothetical protein